MRLGRLSGSALGGPALLLLLSLFMIGCGAASTSQGAPSSATATTTACASPRARGQFQATVGTIQSVSGTMLVIADVRGTSTKVMYSSTTRFSRESSTTLASLKEGTSVTVAITKNVDSTYSATRIMIVTRGAQGTRQRTNANCFTRSQFNNANGSQTGGTSTARGIVGTVGQVNGNILTVTDVQGNDYTMTVSSTTQILETGSASAADLKAGVVVTITGAPDSQGVINARTVTILPKLPTGSTS